MKNYELPIALRLLILSMSLLFIFSCTEDDTNDNTNDQPSIVLGGIAPLSGDAADYGRIDKLVTDMILDEVNANGGINGRQVEVVWRDTKCDPALAEVEARALIDDGITIILGDSCSGSTLAAAVPAEANEVILITAASSNPTIKDAGDFIFRVFPSDDSSGAALAHYANDNYTKIGILTEQTDYAEGITDSFLDVYSGDYTNVSFPVAQSDFATEIAQFETDNVDAVLLMPQTTVKIRAMIEDLADIGWDKDVFGNEILSLDDTISEDYKDELLAWNTVSAAFIPPAGASLDNFIADFEFEYGEEMDQFNYGSTTADRTNMVLQVLEEVGDETNTTAIRDALYAISNYEGLSGSLSFDEYGEVNLSYSLIVFDGENFILAP